jgi:hypothetical protein
MKRSLILFGAIVVTLAAYSQTDPAARWLAALCHSDVGGTKYTCRIGREIVVGGPAWDSSKPLPVSFAEAERLARVELAKLTKDEGAWEVTKFGLERASCTANWYYSLELHPINPGRQDHRYFSIFLTADGKPGTFSEER